MSGMMDRAGEKAHRRSITISTYPVDEMTFVVEGRLVDERCKDYYLITGEKGHAGELHHMAIRLLVSALTMEILDIETDMVAVPREECIKTRDGLKVVKGLRMTRGFSTKIRSLLGGVKGCSHLITLLIEMGPAAMQGIWSYKSQKPVDVTSDTIDRIRVNRMAETLANTCYVWREDGPAYNKLIKQIAQLLKDG